MSTRKIVPRADNEGGLGTTLKRWASAFINALTTNTITLIDGQIGFPATQVPSADVNILDDYEEGTWTPGLTFDAATGITYSAQSGSYTKIGDRVILSGSFTLSSKGSSSGNAYITGLPFVISGYTSVSLRVANITFSGQIQALTSSGFQLIALGQVTEAGSQSALTDANFANNSDVVLNCIYKI